MYDSIETYEKYKNDKKIQKEIEKSKEKMGKRVEYHMRKQQEYLKKQQSLIEDKTRRRILRDKYKINLSFEKKVRKLQGKKPLKKHQKEVTVGQLKKELYKAVQLLARLKEVDKYGNGKCISCGKRVHRTEADGGHYIPRSYMATAFDLRNVHLQCKYCNGRLRGNIVEYRKSLIEKYGEDFVLELENKKNQIKDFSKEELESLLKETLVQIDIQKKMLI